MPSKYENPAAELFSDVWRRDRYSGFSHNTSGQTSTPFLESFLVEVRGIATARPRIVELGAGSCDHALRCAREGFPTTAVEYSAVAVSAARARAQGYPNLPIEIVQADLFAYTSQLAAKSVGAVYANSVFHFLSSEERRDQYRVLRGALAEGGVLGISFKARGDALERRGTTAENTAAGYVVEGEDGIRRLFVARIDALADEMRDEGYAIRQVIRWSVPGYNVSDERGEFIGLLAAR